jgi:hypothetical protein
MNDSLKKYDTIYKPGLSMRDTRDSHINLSSEIRPGRGLHYYREILEMPLTRRYSTFGRSLAHLSRAPPFNNIIQTICTTLGLAKKLAIQEA